MITAIAFQILALVKEISGIITIFLLYLKMKLTEFHNLANREKILKITNHMLKISNRFG